MKTLRISASVVALLGIVWLAAGCASPGGGRKAPYLTIGSLEAKDPRFHDLIAPEAKIEILADGFEWTEGPVWVRDGAYLLFSDIPPNSIFKWKEGEGVSLFQKPSGYTGSAPRGGEPGSNGLALDARGRLVLCEHGDRRIARLESLADPNGQKTTLADRFEGKRLNSPNDLAYHSSGALCFTDPPYGLEKNVDDPAKELGFQGVFRLAPDGGLTLIDRDMTRPNGIAFSPDEKTLYVANSDPDMPVWYAFDVLPDGSATNKRIFHDATPWAAGKTGLPDGMKVDARGNIFASGPGGVCVFAPDGTLLGTIATTQATANCAWGEDGSTLYITADMYLLRIRTMTKGLGF
ncbi:MAG: SMP-30/gluconolactonase/LRE family protein [Planctomycetes bacterium]|nr:SMP-30/gluconolactonase/LRE family protein [Planctomycetota bacterium]